MSDDEGAKDRLDVESDEAEPTRYPVGSHRLRRLEANPLRVEHALLLLREQLRTVQGLRYTTPHDPEGPSKRLANLLRPYREAVTELEEFVLATQYFELHSSELSGYLYSDDSRAAPILRLIAALQAVSEEMGYTPFSIETVEDGSVLVRLRAWWSRVSTDERVTKTAQMIAAEGIRHLENRVVESTQAKVDATNVDSIGRLLDATKDVSTVTARVGALVVVKHGDTVRVRSLSAREQAILDAYPGIMNNPDQFESQLALAKLADEAPSADEAD